MSGLAPVARRAVGAGLLVLSLLPVHRLLDHPRTGPAGEATVRLGDATLALIWWSLLAVSVLSLALGRLAPGLDPGRAGRRADEALSRLSPKRAAWTVALLGGGLALALGLALFHGLPTLLDEMAQLLQARFFAGGMLAGPAPDPAGVWLIQNTLVTDSGWVSQYPPFHTLLLSMGVMAGAPWLVGPAMVGVTVFFTALVAHRLLPGRPSAARWGAALVAVSPFVLVLGSGYLSHVTAAALAAVGLWAGLAARDGRAGWAVLAGLAGGALVATRPWTGLVLSALFTVGVWGPRVGRGMTLRGGVARLALAVLGTLPAGLWLAWYNASLFGGPFRFGYTVAQGPAHGLGFHAGPWGGTYGPLEALGYTAADLLQLGVHLLETPVPLVAVVGAYLLLARRLDEGARILLAWALLPVAANTLYWHHGYHMGPRMLFEAAPAWILLAAVAISEASRRVPSGWTARALSWGVALSVLAAVVLGVPGRLQSHAWTPETLSRITIPAGAEGGLVFVHGGWAGRLSSGLGGLGMRLDSVETAIRRNDACAVQTFLEAWAGTGSRAAALAAAPLDFEPLPGDAPRLRVIQLAPGSPVRVDPALPPTPSCRREAAADRQGVVELAPLLWQGDVPGVETGAPMFVRDLGPDRNAEVVERHPQRTAWLFVPRAPGEGPALQPYGDAVANLWREVPEIREGEGR